MVFNALQLLNAKAPILSITSDIIVTVVRAEHCLND